MIKKLKTLPKWQLATIVGGLGLIAVFFFWPETAKKSTQTADRKEAQKTAAESAPAKEVVAVPATKPVILGVLFGKKEITIKAKSQGEIVKLPMEEGRRIEEGEVIAVIDDRQKKIERELASVEFHSASKDFEKSSKLGKFISRDDLELKRNAMLKKKATFQLKEVDLANSRVVGPISGVITKIYIDKGETVATGDKVAELVQIDDLILQANLPSKEIKNWSLGSVIKFKVPDQGPETFEARVQFISPVIDAATDTVRIKFSVSNPKDAQKRYLLKPGMVAQLLY